MEDERLFEPRWSVSPCAGGGMPGPPRLALKQRRIDGVYVPVALCGEVRPRAGEAGGGKGRRYFLKYFDREFLRDHFSELYQHAPDQRAIDVLLERERGRMVREIEAGRRGRSQLLCPLLDEGIDEGGQRIYAVYPLCDPEKRMDHLLGAHGGDALLRLAAVRAVLDILEVLDQRDLVHGHLDEREIFFPDADEERLGAPRLLPFAPSGEAASVDRQAFARILLRCLGGRMEDIVPAGVPPRGGDDEDGHFDRHLERYLVHRGGSYPHLETFTPLLLCGLRRGAAPPSARRMRELFESALERLAAGEVDRLARAPQGRRRDELRALEKRLSALAMDRARRFIAAVRSELDVPAEIARVQVRGRAQRYRVLLNPPGGLHLGERWIYYARASETFVTEREGVRESLPEKGEFQVGRGLHPFRSYRTSDRMVLETEGFYGERLLYIAIAAGGGGPVVRLGLRAGRVEFDFFGARDSFVPIVDLQLAERGWAVRVHPAARVSDLTLDGRTLAHLEIDRWISLARRGEDERAPLFEVPPWERKTGGNGSPAS